MSIVTGILSCLCIMATAAVTLEDSKRLHLAIAGTGMMSAFICMLLLHLTESRASIRMAEALEMNYPALYYRRCTVLVSFICGWLLLINQLAGSDFTRAAGSMDLTRCLDEFRYEQLSVLTKTSLNGKYDSQSTRLDNSWAY